MPDAAEAIYTPTPRDDYRRCMQNREISWLRFNERLLEEAANPATPLFERFFFVSIFTSNLDEFYMIRVGGLLDHEHNQTGVIDNKTGMNAAEQLARVYEATDRLYKLRDEVYGGLESALGREGLERLSPMEYCDSKKNRRLLDYYFETQIEPLLAPQIVDTSHPFPHIENNRQIIVLSLEAKGGKMTFGMIPAPHGVERLHRPAGGGYMLLEDIILYYSDKVFKHYTVGEKAIVCVTRNADVMASEERFDEDEDFRDHMQKLLDARRRLSPVRLEVRGDRCEKLIAYLQKKLLLTPAQTFASAAPLDMSYCASLRDLLPPYTRQGFSFAPFEPAAAAYMNQPGGVLRQVRQGDVLLSYPYESMQPFLSLVREAADDRHVLSIQIILYRIAEQSKLIEYLIAAAENGKTVVVFIELRARMDEENNIVWAKRMERAGCQVFYGPVGYKLHAKLCLITRRDGFRNEYVTHIGTGNYNEKTARLYTDLSLITVNEAVGKDAVLLFHNLMIGAIDDMHKYALLRVAPQMFKPLLIEKIRREAELGKNGLIMIKCNSLTDRDVIVALAGASRAGTAVTLIVRGICCLLPGIPGLTENICVRSIVGRFLEHSRIYRFGAGEDCEIYIGSGDMMTRNTERRVELFVSVTDAKIKRRLTDMLDVMLADNAQARELDAEGHYKPVTGAAAVAIADGEPAVAAADSVGEPTIGSARFDSQRYFIRAAAAEAARGAVKPAEQGPVHKFLSALGRLGRRDG